MRVSVIVPAYNAANYLAETIESVRAQTASDWELIVVNDGSSDNTAQIANEYGGRDRRMHLLSKENGGVASARNAGYQASDPEAEYICYLDADDVWEPDTLEQFTSALDWIRRLLRRMACLARSMPKAGS